MATVTIYNNFMLRQMNGTNPIDFNAGGVKLALVSSAYTLSQNHDAFEDVVANEVSGSGYTARGTTISSPTVALSGSTVTFDGGNVQWSQNASGFTNARYGIVYNDTGTNSTSNLVACIDFASDKGNVNGDLIIQWNASGILQVS